MYPWFHRPAPTAEYEEALLKRYSQARAKEEDQSAVAAENHADALEKTARSLPSGHADAPKAQADARTARSQAIELRRAIDERAAAEQSLTLVDDALNLQVDKASGLLTFNGLVAALGTILWTERGIRPGCEWIRPLLFLTLVVSAGYTLSAIRSWWETPAIYRDPRKNLPASIELAARRATHGNRGVLATIASTVLVAAWVLCSTRPASSPASAGLPVTLPDSVHLRCEEVERPAKRGLPSGDDINCSIVR